MKIEKIEVGYLSTNCYLVTSKKEGIIIDPGGDYDLIIDKINKKITYIILTHYHPDHVALVKDLKKTTKAKVLIHKDDFDFLEKSGITADETLLDDDEIKINGDLLKIIHTPGHSKGSICILGNNFAFTGDTLFEDGVGRTDLPGGSLKEMEKSLEKIKKLLKPGTKIYPGHGNSFYF